MSLHLNLKATYIELTDAIRSYVEQKIGMIEKLLPADDESAVANVEVGKETRHHEKGEIFRAEVRLHFRGHDLYAAVADRDLYAAIDGVRDEITRQINSALTKKNTLLRRGSRAIKNTLRGLNPWK
jgi:putative sigma-54 modulation protein